MLEHAQFAELIDRCRARLKEGRAAAAPVSPDELEAGLLALAAECSRMTAALEWYARVTPTPSDGAQHLATYPLLAQMILSGAEHESIEAAEMVARFQADPDAMQVLEILKIAASPAETADVVYEF